LELKLKLGSEGGDDRRTPRDFHHVLGNVSKNWSIM
jgi:hypothetical protein